MPPKGGTKPQPKKFLYCYFTTIDLSEISEPATS